jgi:hypothetical protein
MGVAGQPFRPPRRPPRGAGSLSLSFNLAYSFHW